MSILIGLNKYCNNSSGLVKVEYLPVQDIDTALFESLSNNGLFTGNIANTTPFLYAPITPYGKILNLQPQDTNQGNYYNYNVSGRLIGDGPEIVAELDRMKQLRYILKLTDAFGIVRYVGSPEYPCRFAFDYEKADAGQRNSFQIKFSLKTPKPIYFA